jgi:hypothetical protein
MSSPWVEDVAGGGYTADRATVRQKKTGRPIRFKLSKRSRQALDDYLLDDYLKVTGKRHGELLFNGHRGPDRSEGRCCQSQTFRLRGPMAVSCVTNHALHQNFG